MKPKGKKVIIMIGLSVLIGATIIKVTGFQYAGPDVRAIFTTEDIKE
ncbi:hypothetical protein [Romboutsia sp. 1001285H_161024_C4]|nr:hypothetical protein [Romboutsia sp. 1001285H_161024_C4]